MLVLPATPLIEGLVAASDRRLEELSGIANVMVAPPMPFLPEAALGQVVIFALLCLSGEVEAGARSSHRSEPWASPSSTCSSRCPTPRCSRPRTRTTTPTAVSGPCSWTPSTAPWPRTILRHLEPRMRPCGCSCGCWGGHGPRAGGCHRLRPSGQPHHGQPGRLLRGSQRTAPGARPGSTTSSQALNQSDNGVYVNFLADEGPDQVRNAYPAPTWDRLVEVKRKYDPTNLFRLNQNIPPA